MATTKVGLLHDPRKRKPWVVRWFGEFDPETGRQRRYAEAFRLKRDAESFQAAKQSELDKGSQRDRPVGMSLHDFCAKYRLLRSHEWSESTRQHVRLVCDRLIDHFGEDTCLTSISRERAAAFWSAAKKIRRDFEGQELTKSSRNWILRYAKTLFKYAVEWGHIAENPFCMIRAIRTGKQGRRRWHYITPDDYRALLRTAPTLRWKVFYALAYTSGARFGELFNITEDNVDLTEGLLRIRSREGTATLPPFTVKDHEDRVVPLPRTTLRLVAGWLRKRPAGSPLILVPPDRYRLVLQKWRERRAAGKPWLNAYLINNTVRDIRQHAKEAGIKLAGALTVHCFRKSCGQNWANHLPMNVVKEFMGHADIATTTEFYGTVTEDHFAQARWVIEAITKGGSRSATDARMTPAAKIQASRHTG
jgi:integrase